jgi:hypothetical protein
VRLRIAFAFAVVIAASSSYAACGEQLGEATSDDAGTDAANVGPIGVDAPLDVAENADAAPATPFCNTVDATFCWSFDDASNGSALYGPSLVPRANNPVFLTDAARSLPNAMYAEGDGASGYWAVETTFAASKRIVCTAAVWFEEITNIAEVLTFDLATRKVAFQVQPLTSGAVRAFLLYDRSSGKTVSGLPNLPTKQWLDLTLAAERADAGLAFAANALDATVTIELPDAAADFTALDVELGFYAQYGGRGAVRVDDVHCTYD